MNKDKKDLITILNKLQYNIVMIKDDDGESYYSYTEFTTPTTQTFEIIVKGKDITHLLYDGSLISNMGTDYNHIKDILFDKIQALPVVKRRYHKDYKWINYLAG